MPKILTLFCPLQLAYNFSLGKATEITPNFPLLSNVLYESELESQLWMLYNSHKQLVACGDAFPSKWTTKVMLKQLTQNDLAHEFCIFLRPRLRRRTTS